MGAEIFRGHVFFTSGQGGGFFGHPFRGAGNFGPGNFTHLLGGQDLFSTFFH